jgi:hypothetical protein
VNPPLLLPPKSHKFPQNYILAILDLFLSFFCLRTVCLWNSVLIHLSLDFMNTHKCNIHLIVLNLFLFAYSSMPILRRNTQWNESHLWIPCSWMAECQQILQQNYIYWLKGLLLFAFNTYRKQSSQFTPNRQNKNIRSMVKEREIQLR